MHELHEIITGLRAEICAAFSHDEALPRTEGNFDRALQIINGEIAKQENPEIQLAELRGKCAAFELSLNALKRQKY